MYQYADCIHLAKQYSTVYKSLYALLNPMLFLLATRQDTRGGRGKGETKVFFITDGQTDRDTFWNSVLCEKYIGIAIFNRHTKK
jgi:hypothetical protein